MLTVYYIHAFAGQGKKKKAAMLSQNHLKIHTYKPLYRKNKSAFINTQKSEASCGMISGAGWYIT